MARDKILPDSPLRDQHAFFQVALRGAKWTGGPFMPETVEEYRANNLNGPLGLLMALRRYGTCDELKEKYDRVREAAIVNKELPMDEEDRKRLAASFNELGAYIRRLAAEMNRIEKELEAGGWKFNPKTRRVDRIPRKPAGGRPKDYLTECAVFWFKKLGGEENTTSIRRKISSKLRDYFDPRECSTATGAPIHAAIRHHLER